MFIDEMGLYSCDTRRRPSITLDAGYVSVTPINICQTSKTVGLYGKKFICIICIILILFLISFINLTCLIWVMYKLDWSLFDGSKIFRIDKMNQQVEFSKQVKMKEPIYTTKLKHLNQIDLFTDKQIELNGDQNSILFDNDYILLNTDKFHFNNQSLIDFTNLQSYQFNNPMKTRIHLDRFNSQHIHNKRLNLTANNQLTISNIDQAFFYSQYLVLEADRHNRRSILRFNTYPTRKKSWYHQKISSESLHFKSDSIFFDLPRFPLLGNNYRSESTIYRLCICNTTFLFLRTFAHQPCPFC